MSESTFTFDLTPKLWYVVVLIPLEYLTESRLVVNVVIEIWVMIDDSIVDITTVFRDDSGKAFSLLTTQISFWNYSFEHFYWWFDVERERMLSNLQIKVLYMLLRYLVDYMALKVILKSFLCLLGDLTRKSLWFLLILMFLRF